MWVLRFLIIFSTYAYFAHSLYLQGPSRSIAAQSLGRGRENQHKTSINRCQLQLSNITNHYLVNHHRLPPSQLSVTLIPLHVRLYSLRSYLSFASLNRIQTRDRSHIHYYFPFSTSRMYVGDIYNFVFWCYNFILLFVSLISWSTSCSLGWFSFRSVIHVSLFFLYIYLRLLWVLHWFWMAIKRI